MLLLSTAFIQARTQNAPNDSKLTLFTDRDYCLSGDTVWFKVWLPEDLKPKGNVVRIQLSGKDNNLISTVAKQNTAGWSEGFIHVPDSLSTGQYFLTAFLNAQRNIPLLETESKTLIVYNRFEEQIQEVRCIGQENRLEETDFSQGIEIKTNADEFQSLEKVDVTIQFDQSLAIKNAMVKIALVDPLSSEIGGRYRFRAKSSNPVIPDFVENDGFLLSGKVVDAFGTAQKGAVVILSIADEPPYFDYYYTGAAGDFHFFMKDAKGMARIVLQVVSESDEEYFIRPEDDYLLLDFEDSFESKVLRASQSAFAQQAIIGNFIHKLFYPKTGSIRPNFEMPPRFPKPFYGTPTRRIIPDEYIDLPSFQEISRELLPGFQYRVRKGILTFRMMNARRNAYFDDEPLRLINGIPVFKNSFFSALKSTDIRYIDIVQEERIYGDLRFNGILSVVLNDQNNLWMAQQPGVAQFNVECLQQDYKPGYLSPKSPSANQPDIRQTYLWQHINPKSAENLQFRLSDLKGIVEIRVEGMTEEGGIFKASKIIEVK